MGQAPAEGRCGVVYLCAATSGGDLSEIYHSASPPKLPEDAEEASPELAHVYANIRALLDEDQGEFTEVFLCTQTQQCIERLEVYANNMPTAALVELSDISNADAPMLWNKGQRTEAYPFLRGLSADVTGARYQYRVMPFALLPAGLDVNANPLNLAMTEKCLGAGAIDILHSPLGSEDLCRLVGHVKELTRPSARLLGASMAQNLVDSIASSTATKVAQHRPDQCLTKERQQLVEQAIGAWAFAAQDFSMDELTFGALLMLERMLSLPELEPYRIPRAELVTFLLATRRQYKHERQVQYHNWRHAVDVTQSIFCFLLAANLCPRRPQDREARDEAELSTLEHLLTPLDGLILLTSAIGHDVGHPGVNNAFLVACGHPLAQVYNDKSVLENYHCAAYSQLLRRHWPSLSNLPGFRSTMTSNILATDMQRHFEYMTHLSDLKRKVDGSEADLQDWKSKDCDDTRLLLAALLMKAADISNVARPFDVSSRWAQILMSEFSQQGELEAELHMATCLFGGPPKKGNRLAAARSQKGFMDLFGLPLFEAMTEIMPGVACATIELKKNHDIWEDRIAMSVETDVGSDGLTFSSVTKDEVNEAKFRHHNSEPTAVPEKIGQIPSTSIQRLAVVDAAAATTLHPASRIGNKHSSANLTHPEEDGVLSPLSYIRPTSPPFGASSRRSSKDVALEQMQQLNMFAAQSLSAGSGSRRGSADAGWQIHHQSYPASRRGSKDESLTTILFTSQGSPARRASPASFANASRNTQTTPKIALVGNESSDQYEQRSATVRTASPAWDLPVPPLPNAVTPIPDNKAKVESERPLWNGSVVDDVARPMTDGANASENPRYRCAPTSAPDLGATSDHVAKPDATYGVSRMASNDTTDSSQSNGRRSEHGVHQSRSRSRLRSLKFWKKKSEAQNVAPTIRGDGSGS